MSPVFGLQTVGRGEFLFGVQDQTWKSSSGMNLDNPHLEVWCHLVQRVTVHKCFVGRNGVSVTELIEIKFAEVAVYFVLINALALA